MDEEKEKLLQRIEELEKENKHFKDSRKRAFKRNVWIGKRIGKTIIGRNVLKSFKKLGKEVENGKVKGETIGEVGHRVLWRFTRIGVFALLATLIPITVLIIQTGFLHQQNKKIDRQNSLLNYQTELLESERRSSLVFLLSNIMDKMDEELKSPENESRILSDELMGRISSITYSLKPYKYLKNGILINHPLSPERGQLLSTLIKSSLNKVTLDQIYEASNFRYSDLESVEIRGAYLKGIDLSYSNLDSAYLRDVNFYNATLNGVSFNGCRSFHKTNFKKANLSNSRFNNVDLSTAKLDSSEFVGVNFQGEKRKILNQEISKPAWNYAIFDSINIQNSVLLAGNYDTISLQYAILDSVLFQGGDLNHANFSNSKLNYVKFLNADLRGAIFPNAEIRGTEFNLVTINSEEEFKNELKKSFIEEGYDNFIKDYSFEEVKIKGKYSHTILKKKQH